LQGRNVCPGLIDLQIYGTGNHLFSAELTKESLLTIEKELLKQGCTSFYLTLATNTLSLFSEAIDIYKEVKPQVALGLHLEGPFLNSKKRGAHPAELVVRANRTILQDLLEDAEGSVTMMTVAPELFDEDCLAYLLEKKVLVSAGHSDATAAQASMAFDRGVSAVTHLWNAMSPVHHREVGLPGATFNHRAVCASVIVDGIHVDYEAVKLSKQIMQERLFLITDAVAACDQGIYHHRLNGNHYVLPDGTGSGSALTLLTAIKNCVEKVDISLEEAIRMASLYPADLIGRPDIGRIEAGATANILVFDDDYEVCGVYFRGEKLVME
jgi:N-acetylglucosamine-6-phosphate deacetylase